MKQKLLCTLLVFAITISTLFIVPIQADADTADPNTIIMRLNSPSAFLNHSKIAVDPSNPDVSPFTLFGKTMVPVRFVQQLGADVKYTSADEPVTVSYGNIKLTLEFGSQHMIKTIVNDEQDWISLPTPPTLVEGKTCVPIREIAEGLGFSVNYNSGNFVIVVSTSTLTVSQLDSEMKYGADNLPTTVTGVKSITAKSNTRSIAVGGSVQLSATDITFDPVQAGCQLLLYSTSDPDTATVTSQGKVVGVSDGAANITVTSHNGKTTMIRVTVGTGIPSGKTFELLDGKFVPFANAVLPSPLNNADSHPVSFKYDLNGDGNEVAITINVTKGEYDYFKNVCISVNDTVLEVKYIEAFNGIEIVDIDCTDNLKELAIYSSGPSDDYSTDFYRYDGTKIFELGGIAGDWWSRDEVVTDLKGTLVYLEHYQTEVIQFTDPFIVLSYYKISGNKIISLETNSASVIGKQFPISDQALSGDFYYGFWEYEELPSPGKWDIKTHDYDAAREKSDRDIFKPDDKITILKVGNISDFPLYAKWYYVQLNDGRKGVLYFTIAG